MSTDLIITAGLARNPNQKLYHISWIINNFDDPHTSYNIDGEIVAWMVHNELLRPLILAVPTDDIDGKAFLSYMYDHIHAIHIPTKIVNLMSKMPKRDNTPKKMIKIKVNKN